MDAPPIHPNRSLIKGVVCGVRVENIEEPLMQKMEMVGDDLAQVTGIRRTLEAAENAGDADAVAALLADDAVIMVPDFAVQEGRGACAAFLRDILPWQHAQFERHITYTSAEVFVDGDLAFDRGTFAFTVTPRPGGDQSHVTGKYLWILRRANGAWKMARLIAARDEDSSDSNDSTDSND